MLKESHISVIGKVANNQRQEVGPPTGHVTASSRRAGMLGANNNGLEVFLEYKMQ